MLTQKELISLADKYDALHIKNFNLYQQCGEQKYLRAHERYEDMADAFRMAANAEVDFSKKTHFGCLITNFAKSADEALGTGNPETMKGVLRYIVNAAARNKLYWKRDQEE